MILDDIDSSRSDHSVDHALGTYTIGFKMKFLKVSKEKLGKG